MALIAYDSTMRMAYDGWSRRAWKEEEKKREEAGLSKNRPVSVLAAVECDHSSRKAVEMAEYMRLRRQVLQEARTTRSMLCRTPKTVCPCK